MSVEDNNMEDYEVEILELVGDDGETIECVIVADLDMDGNTYVALQVLNTAVPEEIEIILGKLAPDPELEGYEVIELLEEGEEFDEVAAAFEEAFEQEDEEE